MKYLASLFLVLSLGACSESSFPEAFNMEAPPDMDGGMDAGPDDDDGPQGCAVTE